MTKKIAISGSTGLIGHMLSEHYTNLGWTIIPIGRQDFAQDVEGLAEKLQGAQALINLAGSPIASRWTKRGRKRILDSRVLTTRALAEAINRMPAPPQVFLNASAIGIYPDSGVHSEDSPARDHGFMGEVCQAWENETEVVGKHTRVLLLRLGVVLDARGGALARLLPIFRMGVGGKVGRGDQAFSWIHIADLVKGIEFLHLNTSLQGPVNMVAPHPSTNSDFTKSLARALKRPAIIPVPAFALRLIMGDASDIILKGQTVLSGRLTESGFVFQYPELGTALEALVS